MFVPVFPESMTGVLIFPEPVFRLCYFSTREHLGPHVPISSSCCVVFYWSPRWKPKATFSTAFCCCFVQRQVTVTSSHKPLPGPRLGLNVTSTATGLSAGPTEFCLALGRAIIGGPALSCCIISMITKGCHELTLFLKQSHYPRLLKLATGRFIETKF